MVTKQFRDLSLAGPRRSEVTNHAWENIGVLLDPLGA